MHTRQINGELHVGVQRGERRLRLREVVGELLQDGAEALVSERRRIGVARHRQAQHRHHEGARRLETVAVHRLPEPLDGAHEPDAAEAETRLTAAGLAGNEGGELGLTLRHGAGIEVR
jgi:hypothetical protein